MDLNFSAEDELFRLQVRDYFKNDYPKDIIAKVSAGKSMVKADYQRSEQALAKKGWLAVNWPKEHGGPGWSVVQRYIFDEELEIAGALNVIPMGLLYFGPVLYTFGSEAQRERWLPGILNSTTFWAQGYSEPGAGSDLASLTCRADRQGDEYCINGSKIWTSYAHFADWIFCLVRTDPASTRHDGISFICVDIRSPGVEVIPIRSIDGEHHLNRVEFNNVRVPIENRIGDEGKGWHYAQYLLGHERTSYAHVGARKAELALIKNAARTAGVGGSSLLKDPLFASKLARTEIAVKTLEYTTLRILSATQVGAAPGNESSILKILATECAQAVSTLMLELAGADGLTEKAVSLPLSERQGLSGAMCTEKYLFDRAQTIYGGTTEIQKNVIAKQVLGLRS
ncbi:acyl-CoA dehydrogenase [Spongiibacter sp. KMU-166]|uniref:Acyl-CoA dehydrogenase n=1 Tax=Spongiibacter thalassae TaxID=2721624 RepID=A0ABX1G9K9_9GAMM|nr:acyl-CoA dehydrogenase [Spongiibacter thalassae]